MSTIEEGSSSVLLYSIVSDNLLEIMLVGCANTAFKTSVLSHFVNFSLLFFLYLGYRSMCLLLHK